MQRRVAAGVLSAGHARALLSLDDHGRRWSALATRIVAEGLCVRAVEEIIIVGDADGRQRKPSPRSRVSLPRDPSLAEAVTDLAPRLADALDTRVHTDGFATTRSRGRLVIECADLEDLRRIVDLIIGAEDADSPAAIARARSTATSCEPTRRCSGALDGRLDEPRDDGAEVDVGR